MNNSRDLNISILILIIGLFVTTDTAIAKPVMEGKSIMYTGYTKAKICFNNGVCNWGKWNLVYAKIYFGKNGNVYLYNNKDSGEILKLGVSSDGHTIDIQGKKLTWKYQSNSLTILTTYSIRGNSCKAKQTVRFANGNGRTIRRRWKDTNCKIYSGNQFAN